MKTILHSVIISYHSVLHSESGFLVVGNTSDASNHPTCKYNFSLLLRGRMDLAAGTDWGFTGRFPTDILPVSLRGIFTRSQ